MITWHDIKETPIDWEKNEKVLVTDEHSIWEIGKKIRDEFYFKNITHWSEINQPVKKRWMPKYEEQYFLISSKSSIVNAVWGFTEWGEDHREFLGVYKTEQEAEAMVQKIKDFVTSEIGEV